LRSIILKIRHRFRDPILAILCCSSLLGMVAVSTLRAQQGANSGRYEELVRRGEEAEKAGDWDQAIASFQEALKLKPTSALLLTKLADIYLNRKEFEKALDYSGRAFSSDARDVEAAKVAGLAAYTLNKPDLAVKYFQKAIALKSNDGELHYWMGMTLYSLRDARHALDEFYRARLDHPKDIEVLYMIGKIHWEMCRQAWEEMVKVNPDSIRVKQMMAEQAESRNLFPEAIAKYQEIIKQQPDALGFNYALGKLYLHTAEYDKAEEAFKAELRLDPHSPLAHYGLGEVAFERRNLPAALENASQAIKEKPDFGDAYVLLGRVELNMGDKQKAMEVLEHAAALSPSDPSLFYMLGRVYMDLGKRDLAAKAVATYQHLKDQQEKEIRVAQ
jgi:tetratricopeptide (TPR) repeat protein